MSASVTVQITIGRTPQSMNRLGMRGNPRMAHRLKKTWENELGYLILAERLPKNLSFVEASAILRFPVRRRRDASNHGWILDKALGDALVAGGWLEDDQPAYYRWHGLEFDPEPGPNQTTITLIGRRSA